MKTTESVIYGYRKGEKIEDVIFSTKRKITQQEFENVKYQMQRDGITNIRLKIYDGYEKPDFVSTINVQ